MLAIGCSALLHYGLYVHTKHPIAVTCKQSESEQWPYLTLIYMTGTDLYQDVKVLCK